jgi:hypothetical protein
MHDRMTCFRMTHLIPLLSSQVDLILMPPPRFPPPCHVRKNLSEECRLHEIKAMLEKEGTRGAFISRNRSLSAKPNFAADFEVIHFFFRLLLGSNSLQTTIWYSIVTVGGHF